MKIAFCGDSFCRDITADFATWQDNQILFSYENEIGEILLFPSWPYLVAKEYNGNIITKGLAGTALLHSYESLLEVIDEADYIIFCITNPYRLPNKYGTSIIASRYRTWPTKLFSPAQIKRLNYVINYYYTDIISFKWHEVAQKGLLMQIDELMLQKKKKCIWFASFDNSMQGYVPKNGPIGNTDLHKISMTELTNAGMTPNEIAIFSGMARYLDPQLMSRDRQTRVNHMNEENNNNMANLIIDIINNDNFTPKEIKMEKYFEILK